MLGAMLIGGAIVGGAIAYFRADSDNEKAKDYIEEAEDIIKKAKKKLSSQKRKTTISLKKLGQLKFEIYSSNLKSLLEQFAEIKHIDCRDAIKTKYGIILKMPDYDVCEKNIFWLEDLKKKTKNPSTDILVYSALGGVAASVGGALGTASSLSILGIGSAVFLTKNVFDAIEADANLSRARLYNSDAEEYSLNVSKATAKLRAIVRVSQQFQDELVRLNSICYIVNNKLKKYKTEVKERLKESGLGELQINYNLLTKKEKEELYVYFLFISFFYAVLEKEILTAKGNASRAAKKALVNSQKIELFEDNIIMNGV